MKVATSLETFQIAIDEIKKLTEEKQALLEIIKKQEISIQNLNEWINDVKLEIPPTNNKKGLYGVESMLRESNAAMKRYTDKLKKEIDNAKSKQNKRK